MENKYYTPIIEEFYIGFECEIKNSSGKVFDWEQFKIIGVDDAEISNNQMDWSFYDSARAINEGQIRVKYLDSSDVESFGWKQSKLPWQFHNDNSEFYFFIPEGSTNFEILGKDIICISSKRYDDTIFRGKIKNKSELQQILKMIGVIE